MPTGYTAAIADGLTFKDFVMSCARAMGALVTMRDDPADAPIPERFEPNTFYAEKLAEVAGDLARVNGLTDTEATQAADTAYEALVAERTAAMLRMSVLREKYDAMLAQVRAWEPPSADHEGLKKFMIDQLAVSINFDCNDRYYRDQKIPRLTGAAWRAREIAALTTSLAHYEAEHAREVVRTEARNTWLRQLRESLSSQASQSAL